MTSANTSQTNAPNGIFKIDSTALEANIRDHRVEVTIDPKYAVLQEVMAGYYGLLNGLNSFLEELSHPYRNWGFIVNEARRYSLDYFHLLTKHPKGPDAALIFIDIFTTAIDHDPKKAVRADAIDNFLLFIDKILKDCHSDLPRFVDVLNKAFSIINRYNDDYFFLFIKSYYQLNRLASAILNSNIKAEPSLNYNVINQVLVRYYLQTYSYWLSEDDPQTWFQKESDYKVNARLLNEIFAEISHEKLNMLKAKADDISNSNEIIGAPNVLIKLLELPGYKQFIDAYRDIPRKLLSAGSNNGHGKQWKLLFLFHIMNTSGLSMIHEEALKDINRTLSWLIVNEKHWNLRKLIKKTFSILKNRTSRYPETALNCVLNMGKGVSKTDDHDLVNFFIDEVIDMGFQSPMIGGVGDDWQIRSNNAHIQNIRTWMSLIEISPKYSTRLISALIIHLSLCGILLKDTDLFPRDITKFLNSEIEPVYNLCKQLARIFPTYFNDIGAEGKLRDISTRIDELMHRKDILLHFIRKQSHVESSNRIIPLMEATFKFWETKEKKLLKPFIPQSIYRQLNIHGPFVDGLREIFNHLKTHNISIPEGLLENEESYLEKLCQQTPNVSDIDRERAQLAIILFRLLHQKYHTSFTQLDTYLAQLKTEAFPHLQKLKQALAENDLTDKLQQLLEYLDLLKKLILSPTVYESREDIYKKRHFTIDIPSMYGSYHEMKFDALGLTFRLEALVNVLFEKLIENIDLSLITKATFYQIYNRLKLFGMALDVDGILSVEFKRQLDFLKSSLEVRGFTLTQYLDIFKGFTRAVQNIINDNFTSIHDRNFNRIFCQIPSGQILPKFIPKSGLEDRENLKHRSLEIFFRERISLSLGLQQLDIFLTKILNTLFKQSNKLDREKLQLLLLYDPKNAISRIGDQKSVASGIIHLGNKGLNMVHLKQMEFPIPPGFIITTEIFRIQKVLENYPPAEENFREKVIHEISSVEKETGKFFGNPDNPLLFSVRSGSSISQPGMMDTFLNVGNNEEITKGLASATGKEWFAWDNFRRFLQCYGMAFGLQRDDFDAIISEHKKKLDIPLKRYFSGNQMKQVALAYKQKILSENIEFVEDPLSQLLLTIKKVFESWESPKAKTYRKIMGISDDWGTAVTVQAMVYGNYSRDAGTGVFFTHNPKWSGDILSLYGDFTLGNQGEDVVSGLVKTLPISIKQQDDEMRDTDVTLETHFPEIYNALEKWAKKLVYKKGWSPQEMEFTFEGPTADKLYILQTRDMAIRGRKELYKFDLEQNGRATMLLGHGIGVAGGAMSGRVVFNLDEIDYWRAKEPETKLILVRGDTVPDDISEIHSTDGLLTARGGLTSHAAVVAHRLGKVCVVGCENLDCNEINREIYFNQLRFCTGDFISIDGQEGSVYQGFLKVKKAT
ncbi:MAG: PEP/pyruvate-binding domain-containing protein [Desulfobacterales bacterium]